MQQHGRGRPTRLCGALSGQGYTSTAPGEGAGSGAADPQQTAQLLVRLAARLQNHQPSTDGAIPAGYTYLGQIAAHDLTSSLDPALVPESDPPEISRTRYSPLHLETLYGDGPGGSPALYEGTPKNGRVGDLERHGRLRLGLTRDDPAAARDIPRLGCPLASVAGEPRPTAEGWACPSDAGGHPLNPGASASATEALLADVRNDDSLLISQLLTVFIRLHNRLYDAVAANGSRADAYRRARAGTTAIYRRILAEDFFPRLIGKDIFDHYRGAPPPDSIPVEFKHGAFRVCHSMIRGSYSLRRKSKLLSGFIRRRSATIGAQSLPIEADWIVDWREFFDLPDGSLAANYSRPLGPSINLTLAGPRPFSSRAGGPAEPGDEDISLVLRDLLRAAELVHVSLPGLRDEIPDQFFGPDAVFRDVGSPTGLARAQREIWQWLVDEDGNRGGRNRIAPLSDTEAAALSVFGPLPFLIAFEAMRDGGGMKFGPLGASVIARTVAPLLDDQDSAALSDAASLLGTDAATFDHMGSLVHVIEAGNT